MLKVILIVKLKNGELKTIILDWVSNIFVDYANNKLTLIDYSTGLDCNYHFRPTGKEREQEATEILSVEIIKKEE